MFCAHNNTKFPKRSMVKCRSTRMQRVINIYLNILLPVCRSSGHSAISCVSDFEYKSVTQIPQGVVVTNEHAVFKRKYQLEIIINDRATGLSVEYSLRLLPFNIISLLVAQSNLKFLFLDVTFYATKRKKGSTIEML